MTIARMWRGWVPTEKGAEYAGIVERTGMAGYRDTPGNIDAQLLTRDLGDGRTEIITLSWWPDLDHIRGFAGDDISVAHYYPEDDGYLLERERTVAHFEVAQPSESAQSSTPAEIAAAFSAHRFAEAYPQLSPEVRWVLVGGPTLNGPAEVIAACEQTLADLAASTTEFLRFVVAGNGPTVAVDAVGRYTDADGTVSTVSSCDIYEFVDGLITVITSYTVELPGGAG